MKLWIDDVRPAPEGYYWCKSVNEAKKIIRANTPMWDFEPPVQDIEIINIDHDAGEYVNDGGDYIKLLDWLEEAHLAFPIHIHSMNPVGVENMRAIIRRNGWREI